MHQYDVVISKGVHGMKERYFYWSNSIATVILALGVIMLVNFASGQVEIEGRSVDYISGIYVETFIFKSDQIGKGRVDIDIQVPYEEISFIKDNDQYVGHFEITATITTTENQQVWQKNQLVELRLRDFAQTTSNRLSSIKQFSTDLSPGTYELLLQVVDQESKKISKYEHPLKVADFSNDSLAISDIMLVSRASTEGIRKSIVPNLTDNIGQDSTGFSLFFEIYNKTQLDSIQMLCKCINTKQEVVLERRKSEVLSGNLTQVVWKIDTPFLAAGRYVISIEVDGHPKDRQQVLLRNSQSRTCFVRIKDLPSTITDIDKAIEQLKYIAKGSEIDYIREAPTPQERQKRFLDFWVKHNIEGKSTRNALMEEYYARVAYANKNFTRYIEGWRTDMGMIFIQFGQPQNVERHPFESNSKPYEIWYYYDQNRQFIFVDDTGFGDYHLQYPTTDLWGRIR